MSFKKPFSEILYNKHDFKAREKVIEIFKETFSNKETTLELKEPLDKYQADIDVYKNNKLIGHLELEIKNNWINDKFPFKDVQFLERKKKYNKKTIWVLFNKNLSRHLVAKIKDIIKCPTRNVVNKYSNGELETFYIVPISMVKFNELSNILKIEDKRKDK